jgi:hypothetical protein
MEDAGLDNQMIKVSVLLPGTVHYALKREALEERMSLQKLLAGKLATSEEKTAAPEPAFDSLRLTVGANSNDLLQIDNRTITNWQNRLKKILQHGNPLAVLNCTATIEAMEMISAEKPSANGFSDDQSQHQPHEGEPEVEMSLPT